MKASIAERKLATAAHVLLRLFSTIARIIVPMIPNVDLISNTRQG